MAKQAKVAFVCQNCGEDFPKWQGQCENCGAWNTLVEMKLEQSARGKGGVKTAAQVEVTRLGEVELASALKRRLSSGIGELDRVLGGGMVPGGVMLIGGEPGIGKSTLLTQMVVELLSQPEALAPIAYVCGEESPSQIALRINRLLDIEQKNTSSKKGKTSGNSLAEQLLFVSTTDVDDLVQWLSEHQPKLVIVDSIQTLQTSELTGAEGSIGQLKESTARLIRLAKQHHLPLFLVGHVTKEGAIAGPKVLEHMVDAVLELSGERTGQLRILRSIKNRFGATDEVGVFKVNETGLAEVSNPSELLLEEADRQVPGSAVVCVMEGTRPLLLEVQALVVDSQLAMPRRVGRGVELSRIQVLAAVLQKHVRLPLGSADIFVSAAGGMHVKEPSIDLGLAVAVASSLVNQPLPPKTVFIGEVGLLGEIRSVSYLERRIKEAKRLGYEHIISRQSHRALAAVFRDLGLKKVRKPSAE